ncbi:unnamed protein product, partial [Nesidiocoris tenuis]
MSRKKKSWPVTTLHEQPIRRVPWIDSRKIIHSPTQFILTRSSKNVNEATFTWRVHG